MALLVPDLSFDRYRVHLKLQAPVKFHFHHGWVLYGLLKTALREGRGLLRTPNGSEETIALPGGVIPDVSESGRVAFGKDDTYAFGLTLVGDSCRLIDTLMHGLEIVGKHGGGVDQPPPTLGRNFLIDTPPIRRDAPDLDAQLERVTAMGPSVAVRLLSPVRIWDKGRERPFARDFSPPSVFLHVLARRLEWLAAGCPPKETKARHGPRRPDLPLVEVRSAALFSLDVPATREPGDPAGVSGGWIGRVVLDHLPREWLRLLLLGQYLHVGAKTHMGFGRYLVEGGDDDLAFLTPSSSLLDAVCASSVLEDAFDHVVTHSEAPGVDHLTPDAAVAQKHAIVTTLRDDVSHRRYRAEPLLGFLPAGESSKVRALAPPTIRDRVIQRAAATVLSPILDGLLEDCSFAYRRGTSRAKAAVEIERAYDDGFRWVLDGDITSFFATVKWERLFSKLDALFPFEPLVPLLKERITTPVSNEFVPLRSAQLPASPDRTPFYVVDPDSRVWLSADRICAQTPTHAGVDSRPIANVSHVVFIGHERATLPLVLRLAESGVPCYFCHRTGELSQVFGPHRPDWPTWLAQAQHSADENSRLTFSRAVVQAKLHNTATLAVRFDLPGARELGRDLREIEANCLHQARIDGLMGLEGEGARCWFSALRESFHETWGFPGRHKRPPTDPVNAMLSLAYTLLYNHISTAVFAVGLNPRIGLFHEQHGAHNALASDLEEEFRFLADAHVIALLHRKQVKPSDFEWDRSHGEAPCCMNQEALRAFLHSFEQRLVEEFTPPGSAEKSSNLEVMARQAWRFRELVLGLRAAYEPLRIHA